MIVMNWFRNLGIAPKTLSVLALFSALAIGFSALAITSLSHVYGEASVFTGTFDRNVEFLPIELDKAERDKYEAQSADELKRPYSRVDQLEKLVTAPEGRKNAADIRAEVEDCALEILQVLDLDGVGRVVREGAVEFGEQDGEIEGQSGEDPGNDEAAHPSRRAPRPLFGMRWNSGGAVV